MYLLTSVCHDRRRVFADFEVACAAARALADTDVWRDASLLAWVLMPDHWHGLVALGPRSDLSSLMRRAKALSGLHVGRTAGTAGGIWQRGFHDRALRSDEDLRVAARYVVANPLRAGLVSAIAEYPFWDCVWGDVTRDID